MNIKAYKAKRAYAEISQRELAKEMNMDIRSYNLKENGKRSFSIKDVQKLCKALNLNLVELNEIFNFID